MSQNMHFRTICSSGFDCTEMLQCGRRPQNKGSVRRATLKSKLLEAEPLQNFQNEDDQEYIEGDRLA